MYKVVVMLKKRAGMSDSDFRKHYEDIHAPLGLSLMPRARRYTRKYLDSGGSKSSPTVDDAFDVITEAWFQTEEDYLATIAEMQSRRDELDQDEFNLFDRAAARYYVVVNEAESVIPE
jgi:uncharacterized protein (TIGR02118 family)